MTYMMRVLKVGNRIIFISNKEN